MKLADFCKSYFNGFQNLLNYKKNDAKTNILVALKILSLFTVVIPLGFATVYGAASLYGRICKKEALSSHDKNVNHQASKQLKLKEINEYKIIQTSDSKVVHSYTGDLTSSEKSKIEADFIDNNTLRILFQDAPHLNVTIRQQDIFDSQAEVITNAANTHLGGGGGIDGAIHKRGGPTYQAAQQKLQKLYKSKFVSGHAAFIGSGSLKEKHNIHNVIVVAGPQGKTSPQKESELYSCYYNSLLLSENQNKTSIAFPSISTGIYKFPKERAACISLKAIYDFINRYPNTKLKNISIHFLPSKSKDNLETYEKSCCN